MQAECHTHMHTSSHELLVAVHLHVLKSDVCITLWDMSCVRSHFDAVQTWLGIQTRGD